MEATKNILFLSSKEDQDAHKLAQYCISKGLEIVLLNDQELLRESLFMVHANNLNFNWTIEIPSRNLILSSDNIGLIYNRISYFNILNFKSEQDNIYAANEWQALLSGWLRWCDLKQINEVHPTNIIPNFTNNLELLRALSLSGLPTAQMSFTSTPTRVKLPSKIKSQIDIFQLSNNTKFTYKEIMSTSRGYVTLIKNSIHNPFKIAFEAQIKALGNILKSDFFRIYFEKTLENNWVACGIDCCPNSLSENEIETFYHEFKI